MARPTNNIRKALLRIKIPVSNYKALIALGNSVHAGLTGNLAFSTPLPALTVLQSAIDDCTATAGNFNNKRNKGSKATKLLLTARSQTLLSTLVELLAYVTQTALIADASQGDAFSALIATSGFGLRSVRSLTPKAQQATFIRQTNNKLHPGSEQRLNWKRPLGLIKGQRVAGYIIMADGMYAGTTTKCNTIIQVDPTKASQQIQIIPFNSKGRGQAFEATVKRV